MSSYGYMYLSFPSLRHTIALGLGYSGEELKLYVLKDTESAEINHNCPA